MTKVAVPKERHEDETRVAASPETVKKMTALGLHVVVETGAGAHANFSDALFKEAGATLASDTEETLKDADIVLKVRAPLDDEFRMIKPGASLIAMLAPYDDRAKVRRYASSHIDAYALEFMPRISRAQSMDVLSSQSNLAGYKAVIDAAAAYGRAMPMMMTAAGSIAPARVLVVGAGVAGLQAIATAKRLGATVSATDVRPAVKEQVESLGGTFVMVESDETGTTETDAGYAREMSGAYQRAQAGLIEEAVKKQDIVICTALIPGKPAPVLITDAMVRSMKPGSIIVDLAVEQGGNCEPSRPGETVTVDGVRIFGQRNVPGRLAADASALYARNLLNFVTLMVDGETGGIKIDWDDEIIAGTALTRDGVVIHPALTD